MTPGAPQTGFSTGTAMDPNNPPQVSAPQPQVGPQPVVEPGPLQWISNYYQSELGRDPDQEGLNFWLNSVQSGQNSLDDVRNAINNSQEGQRYDINSLYKNDLGREADEGGFNFWLNALQNGVSLDDIRNQGFLASDEYKNKKPVSEYPEIPKTPIFGDSPFDPGSAFTPGPTPMPIFGDSPTEPKDSFNPKGFDPRSLIGRRLAEEQVRPRSGNPFTGDPGFSIPNNPYETDDFNNPGKGTGSIKDLFGGSPTDPFLGMPMPVGMGGEIAGVAKAAMDPVADFVKNIGQQPQYVQNAFGQALTRFGDPVAAARAVLGSLK